MTLGKNPERTLVVAVRLSAIGDTVIAARAVVRLIDAGFPVVFCTRSLNRDVVFQTRGLRAAFFYDDEKTVGWQIPGAAEKRGTDAVAELQETAKLYDRVVILDMQNTGRSRRATKALTRILREQQVRVHRIEKRTLYRAALLLAAGCAPSQRFRSETSFSSYQRVLNLHLRLFCRVLSEYSKSDFTDLVIVPPFLAQPWYRVIQPGTNYIVIFPGASARLKAWPQEHFRTLIRKVLLADPAIHLLICGGESEKGVGAFLAFDNNDRVHDLTGKTSLAEIFSIIAHAGTVVTGDSFATHIADAFGIPCVVLFGATSPAFGFAPSMPRSCILYKRLSCSPCSRHGQGECRFQNLKCLVSIDPNEVFSLLNLCVVTAKQS